jgi:membrane protein
MNKKDIYQKGEEVEARSYETLARLINRVVCGLFVFKTRKGEIVAASSTFFIMMSFLPMILLTISVYAMSVGDVNMAHSHVMHLIKDNIPGLAKWIFNSIDNIVASHLAQTQGTNWLSGAVLCYAIMGYSSSLIFGLNTLAEQKSRGGKIFEDSKAFFGALSIGAFMIGFTMLNADFGFWLKTSKGAWWGESISFMLRYNIIQTLASLSFFGLFYKGFIPGKIRNIDAVIGAASFVGLFILGKSFYWVYLHHIKAELASSFGNFETLVVAVTWLYYLQCSFFFGASVACAPMRLRKENVVNQEVIVSEDFPPELPSEVDDKVA